MQTTKLLVHIKLDLSWKETSKQVDWKVEINHVDVVGNNDIRSIYDIRSTDVASCTSRAYDAWVIINF